MEGQKVTSRKYYEMELQKLNASLLEMGEMIRMAIGGAVTALLEFDHDKAREIIAYDEQIDRQNREIELMLENLPTLSCAPIRQMATETSVMLIKSLEAFAQRDEEKANWVIDRDDVVDDLFDTVKSELIEAIRQNADNGEAATDLLMAAKYFERIGDHATNIAQWAIFSITGEMPKD